MIETTPRLARDDSHPSSLVGGTPRRTPRGCLLCRCYEPKKAFDLPVLDGPYETDPAWTTRSFYRCCNCGFLFAHPFEPELYARYYAKLTDSYHEEHNQENSRYSSIFRALQPLEPKRILDWGCGNGTFLNYFGEDVEKYGVEICSGASNRARQSNIQILTSQDIEQGKLAHSFDAVAAIDVVEHIANLNRLRDSVAKVLCPGGTFAVLTGNLDSLAAKFLGRYWYYLHYAEHISFLTEQAARQWLQTQFEDIRILRVSHHKSALPALVRAISAFPVAWILEKIGLAEKLRISAKLYVDWDHMLILARRKAR